MSVDIRKVRDMNGLIAYFAETLNWKIDLDDFDDIEDIAYDFEAEDIGLKEEAFAKIKSLRQLPPLVDGQKWGIFCVEFDSRKFEVTALRKILSGLIPKRRNSADHAVWNQQDLLFICFWGEDNDRTIGVAHFEDVESGLPQIKMISCAPALEDFTQIKTFEDRLKSLKWPMNYVDHEKWQADWSSAFTTGYKQAIRDASTLTIQLAIEAQGIRNRILDILEVESPNGYVHLLYEKFRNTLIHDMTETQFADMYAQTVVYGLFSARCMDETQDDFSAAEAVECIPNTNPFLKHLMKECLGAENTGKLSFDELEIGNVVDLLKHTKTDAIIADFNRQTGGGREDPVIHFYEEFLAAYDKMQKVQRGVYYTPQPVVNFIVRAVDTIIKKDFGLKDGLASTATKTIKVMRQSKRRVGYYFTQVEDTEEVPAIQVLDPATGTGTFIRQTILQIYENFKEKNKGLSADELKKAWNVYVPEHLLPRINAFELMMAPYAVAHMKLAMVLRDTGYEFESDNRLNVYLTNSLEEPGNSDGQLTLWSDPLATESIAANAVKKNTGINIVIGNPPYSTESANKGNWIDALMETYKTEADGRTKLREKNSKPINDDYIKFIRYAQSVLETGGYGVLAFINPHGFVDGPIFRGMRSSLLREFSKIYILDLHGNANRQEVTPDGSKDENVFDIKQGVCILIAIRQATHRSNQKAEVYKADLWGSRDEKYSLLSTMSFDRIQWQKIQPQEPMNMFFAEDSRTKTSYEDGFSVRALFNVNGTGVLTKRDDLCIQFTPNDAYSAAKDMLTKPANEVIAKYSIPDDVRDWKFTWAKEDLIAHGLTEKSVKRITYRPFDYRYTYYTGQSRGFMGWPVHAVMQHMINTDNIALVTARSNKTGNSTHFFVSTDIVEYKCGERTTNSSVFPLYFMEDGSFFKKPNYNEDVVRKIEKRIGLSYTEDKSTSGDVFDAYDLFCYIYAVLYSPRYRSEYKDFLNRDFPVIPYPNAIAFRKLCALGHDLVETHLLKKNYDDDSISFVGDERRVDKIAYSDGKVVINRSGYFVKVPADVWEFIVGGYQPCHRWLRERKGRELSIEDIEHYRAMIGALKHTQFIMRQIDQVTEALF